MLTAKPITARELEKVGAVITFEDQEGEAEKKLKEICDLIERCGPKAMVRSKKLIRSQANTGLDILSEAKSQENKGGGGREGKAFDEVKEAFQEMMAPSEEALEGILTFRKTKGKEDVNWLEFYKEKKREREEEEKEAKSKL